MRRLILFVYLITLCLLPFAFCFNAQAQDSTRVDTLSTVKFNGRTSVPSLSSTGNAVCYFDKSSGKLKCSQNGGAFADWLGGGSGGSTDPGGSTTQVQFNDAGVFGGDAGLVYNKTTNFLTIASGGLTLSSSPVNKVTITPPASGSTLTIQDGFTLTVSGNATVSGTNTGDQTSVSGNAGTATALATARAIYGNNFDGTAALTQIIASTFGGTGNGFTKLSGPTSTEKTFTLPNASATVLTDNAAVTVAQGGTGIQSGTSGGVPYFSGSTTIASSAALTANLPVIGGGTGAAPSVGTRQGNTTKFVTYAGSAPSTDDCAKFDSNGNLTPAGAPCGAGGGGISGLTTGTIPQAASSTTLSDSVITQASSLIGIGLGAVAPPTQFTVGDTGSGNPRGILGWQASTDTGSSQLGLRKSRGTFASPVVVVTGDNVGRVRAEGFDGTSYVNSSNIIFGTTGTIGTGRVPGIMTFQIMPDVASPTLTSALQLTSTGAASTGLNIDSRAAGSGLVLTTIGGNSSEALSLASKGTANLTLTGSTVVINGLADMSAGGFLSVTSANGMESNISRFGTSMGSTHPLFWTATTPSATPVSGIAPVAAGVLRLSDGSSGYGWQQWAGESYVGTNQTNASTTLQTTTLSVTLAASRKYLFKAILYVSDDTAAEGVKADFGGGTATATNFRTHCTGFDTALGISTQVTSLTGTVSAGTFTGSGMIECHGSFEVNGAGTFIPRFAQNSHVIGTLTLFRGSHLLVWDTP